MPNAGERPLLQLVLPIDLVSIVLKQFHITMLPLVDTWGQRKHLVKYLFVFIGLDNAKILRGGVKLAKCASRKSPIPTRKAPLSLFCITFPFRDWPWTY